jgi:hypothetical protein
MGGACEGVCGTSVNECCMRTGKYEVLCVVCVHMDMLCIRDICMSMYECMCRMRMCMWGSGGGRTNNARIFHILLLHVGQMYGYMRYVRVYTAL